MSCSCRERRRSLSVTCATGTLTEGQQQGPPPHSNISLLSTAGGSVALETCNPVKSPSPTTAISRLLLYRFVKALGLSLPVTTISFQWPLVTLLHCSRSRMSCPCVFRGSRHHECSSIPTAKPSLPRCHPSLPSSPRVSSQRSGSVLSAGQLVPGDTATSKRLAAAPAPVEQGPEHFGNSTTTQSRHVAGTAETQAPQIQALAAWQVVPIHRGAGGSFSFLQH